MPTQQFAGSRAEAEGGQLSQQISVKLLNFPHGYRYFWGIELILSPYSMLSWASLSALWKWYNMGLEAMPRDHPNPLRPGAEAAQACFNGCRTFTSKPWPRGLHGPPCTRTAPRQYFYFWKIPRESAKHRLHLPVYYLAVVFFSLPNSNSFSLPCNFSYTVFP